MTARGWPRIREIQTTTFPNLGPSFFSTNLVTGKRGAWTSIPRKPHTLNSLRGTEMRYSWKKAEVRNTMSVAVVRELPEVTRGLYRCLTHHLGYYVMISRTREVRIPVDRKVP